LDLLVNEVGADGVAELCGCVDDLRHEGPGGSVEMLVIQNLGDIGGGGDAEAVEWDVPNELAPALGDEALHGLCLDAGALEIGDDPHGAVLGRALELADGEHAVAEVLDDAGRGTIEAYEAEPAHDAAGAEIGGEEFFVAETVLKGDEGGIGSKERGDEGWEGGVRSCFQANEYDIARADLTR